LGVGLFKGDSQKLLRPTPVAVVTKIYTSQCYATACSVTDEVMTPTEYCALTGAHLHGCRNRLPVCELLCIRQLLWCQSDWPPLAMPW